MIFGGGTMTQDFETIEKVKAENRVLRLRLNAGLLLLKAIGIALDEYIKQKLFNENFHQGSADSSDQIIMFIEEIRNFGKSTLGDECAFDVNFAK